MTAFPKAAVQNVRVGTDLNVRLWPKAAIETESGWVFLNGCSGEKADIWVLELRARANGCNRPKAVVEPVR